MEITAVDDLVKGDFTEIFKGALVLSQSGSLLSAGAWSGAHVLIHTASPLIGREATPEAALDVSCDSLDVGYRINFSCLSGLY